MHAPQQPGQNSGNQQPLLQNPGACGVYNKYQLFKCACAWPLSQRSIQALDLQCIKG